MPSSLQEIENAKNLDNFVHPTGAVGTKLADQAGIV